MLFRSFNEIRSEVKLFLDKKRFYKRAKFVPVSGWTGANMLEKGIGDESTNKAGTDPKSLDWFYDPKNAAKKAKNKKEPAQKKPKEPKEPKEPATTNQSAATHATLQRRLPLSLSRQAMAVVGLAAPADACFATYFESQLDALASGRWLPFVAERPDESLALLAALDTREVKGIQAAMARYADAVQGVQLQSVAFELVARVREIES